MANGKTHPGTQLPQGVNARAVRPTVEHGRWTACALLICVLAGCQPQHSSDGMTASDRSTPATLVGPTDRSLPLLTGATTAPGREFTSVSAIFAVIPATILPGPAGNWTEVKINAANRVLAREVLGHPARIAGRVRSIGIAPGTFNPRYTGLPRTRLGQPAIGEIPVTLYAYFPPSSTEQLAAINPGDPIAATGTLSRADLTAEPNGHGIRLNVDLIDCHASR